LTGSGPCGRSRCNRCPSAIVTGRANTSGGRPHGYLRELTRKQPDNHAAKDQLHEQRSCTRH
jgi:hypothetical protein